MNEDMEQIGQLTSRLRELGCVVAVFTDEELKGVPENDRSRVEDAMVEAGNREIEYLQ